VFRNWFTRCFQRPSRFSQSRRGRRPLILEQLEGRNLLSAQPISLADPSFYGTTGNGQSGSPSLSADGQLVAFSSNAGNLVPGDTNGATGDIFVRNLSTGATTLVSVNKTGGTPNADSYNPVISPDGRYVAFLSRATDVTSDDTGGGLFLRDLQAGTTTLLDKAVKSQLSFSDDGHLMAYEGVSTTGGQSPQVFVRSLTTGTTTEISLNLQGQEGNGESVYPVLSGNGQFVVFTSYASDLVANDTNNTPDVFVRNLAVDTTTLVSVNDAGTGTGNAQSGFINSISADGRYVAFDSLATDLVPGFVDHNGSGSPDVYVRDLQLGTTTLVSVNRTGTGGDNGSEFDSNLVMTPDGRYVAFESFATNLTTLSTGLGYTPNIFLRDLQQEITTLVSVNSAGTAGGNSGSTDPHISSDGRYLEFVSTASNLVANDTNGASDVFIRDLPTGTTILASGNQARTDSGNGASPGTAYSPYSFVRNFAALSADGRTVAFSSDATNLTTDADNNHTSDLVTYNVTAGTTTLASARDSALPAAFTASGTSSSPSVSADGRYVAFYSSAGNLLPGVGGEQIYVRDTQAGTTTLVSANTQRGGADYQVQSNPIISSDGRYVFFESRADDLTAQSETGGSYELYRRDLQTNTTVLVSVDSAGTAGGNNGVSTDYSVAVSPDDRYVAFQSPSTDLVSGYAAGTSGFTYYGDIYLRDLQTETTTLVSVSSDGTTGANTDYPTAPQLSADGRYVAFASTATNLAANTPNGGIFVRDVQQGKTVVASINAAGTAGDRGTSPVLTPDGRYVAFVSPATDLVTGITKTTESGSVYRRDLQTGTTVLVSVDAAGTGPEDGTSDSPVISADGRYVAFSSTSTNLIPGGTTQYNNAYVRDLTAGKTTLVTVSTAGGDAGGVPYSSLLQMSSNGQFLTFQDTATNLVPGFTARGSFITDIYVRNLQAGTTSLVSASTSGTGGGNGDSSDVQLSADGGTVVFNSDAANLYAGDTNAHTDVFFASTGAGFGRISGEVFSDLDGDGTQQTGEPGLAGVTVFLDTNGNGQLDPGEPGAVSDSNGNYALTGLSAGTYTVAQVLPAHTQQTLPPVAGNVHRHPCNVHVDGEQRELRRPAAAPRPRRAAVHTSGDLGNPRPDAHRLLERQERGQRRRRRQLARCRLLLQQSDPRSGRPAAGHRFADRQPGDGRDPARQRHGRDAADAAWHVLPDRRYRPPQPGSGVKRDEQHDGVHRPHPDGAEPDRGHAAHRPVHGRGSGPLLPGDPARRAVGVRVADQCRHERGDGVVYPRGGAADALRLRRPQRRQPAESGRFRGEGSTSHLLHPRPQRRWGGRHRWLHAPRRQLVGPGRPGHRPDSRWQYGLGDPPHPRPQLHDQHRGPAGARRDATHSHGSRLPRRLAPLRHLRPDRPCPRFVRPAAHRRQPDGHPARGLQRRGRPD
jgi:Tol biopolymer transport system component